jgi:hypothetical protein
MTNCDAPVLDFGVNYSGVTHQAENINSLLHRVDLCIRDIIANGIRPPIKPPIRFITLVIPWVVVDRGVIVINEI